MRFTKILLTFILFEILSGEYSQGQDLKTMIESVNEGKNDTVQVGLMVSICDSLFRTRPTETIKYGTDALKLARNLKFQKGEAYALKYIGMGHFTQGEYVKAIDFFQQSLEKFETIGDKRGIANILSNIGVIYNNEGNDAKALELYLRSLKLSEEINDSVRIVTALVNIGLIYSKKESTMDKAEDSYLKALKLSEELDYSIAIGTLTVNLGELFFSKGDYKKALLYFERSLKAYRKVNSGNIPYTLINIGKIYAREKYYQNAFKYMEEALAIAEQNNSKLEIGQALLAIANTYLQKGDTQNALKYYTRSEQITSEIGAMYERRESYDGLARTYAKRSDYNNAYRYQLKESQLKDTLFSETSQLQLNNLQKQFEIESMLKENEILKRDVKLKETKNRLQLLAIFFLFLGLASISIFMILLVRANNLKKKANSELAEKNVLITSQKQAITDSIHYAGTIQNALLPPSELINNLLPHSFIIFRPRDIVSGDFYWLTESHGRIICIAADCTGHGVPGAFMSMLGIAILNEIISRNPEINAGEILNEMRKYVMKFLHQNRKTGESKDGMDVALLIFNKEMTHVEYAGANNPLIIIRDSELQMFKPDKMPIGIHFGIDQPFSRQEIEIRKGDMLYIFSDGYVDQFGGPEGKKFMIKNFKDLLVEVNSNDLKIQKQIIESRLEEWMGHLDQVDDIMVIGVRI